MTDDNIYEYVTARKENIKHFVQWVDLFEERREQSHPELGKIYEKANKVALGPLKLP